MLSQRFARVEHMPRYPDTIISCVKRLLSHGFASVWRNVTLSRHEYFLSVLRVWRYLCVSIELNSFWTYNIELTLAIPFTLNKFWSFLCHTIWRMIRSAQIFEKGAYTTRENPWSFFHILLAERINLDFDSWTIARHHIWDFAENWLQFLAKKQWFFADKNSDFLPSFVRR